MNTYLLDTNILVYAYNNDSPFHKKAYKLLDEALNGKINTVLIDKNLYEFFAIITDPKRVAHPVTPKKAFEVIKVIYESAIRVLYPNEEVLFNAFSLAQSHKITKQQIFDLVIIATMLQHQIKYIYTANVKDFSFIKEIIAVNPLN